MNNSSLPKAIYEGELNIHGLHIPCAVLENGERVLSQRGLNTALGRSAPSTTTEEKLPAILAVNAVKPFISEELMQKVSEKKFYITKGNFKAIAIPAALLPEICDVWLKARDAQALTSVQMKTANAADILMRALAHVGIAALVDEATGYQDVRARNALEKILEEYVTNELRKWIKTFPDEFYKEMFRLRGWEYKPWTVKRPSVIGLYTNDLVYDRLAPGIKDELQKLNPKNSSGRRKDKHFQYLTDESGHPKLREHIASVITLMRISDNWENFMVSMNKALPKYGSTIQLDLV